MGVLCNKAMAGKLVLQGHSFLDIWSQIWFKVEMNSGGRFVELHVPAALHIFDIIALSLRVGVCDPKFKAAGPLALVRTCGSL